jgi:uncharacterized protein
MSVENIKPWWKFGYVWMVIGGPLVVIVASFITLYYAIKVPDPVIENYYVKGIEINKTLAAEDEAKALAPAMKARNHAATGVEAQED